MLLHGSAMLQCYRKKLHTHHFSWMPPEAEGPCVPVILWERHRSKPCVTTMLGMKHTHQTVIKRYARDFSTLEHKSNLQMTNAIRRHWKHQQGSGSWASKQRWPWQILTGPCKISKVLKVHRNESMWATAHNMRRAIRSRPIYNECGNYVSNRKAAQPHTHKHS